MDFCHIGTWLAAVCLVVVWPAGNTMAAGSQTRIVVSFSILEDMVRQIGGDDVAVTSLIGADSDAHVFEPRPDQARLLSEARLLIINGLRFEGWLARLIDSAQYRGPVIVATEGIAPIMTGEGGPEIASPDPHAWQDVRNAFLYTDNIARALSGSDPAHAQAIQERFRHYQSELETLDRQVHAELDVIPVGKRKVITSHDAFAYYGKAYGVTFLAPEGVNTESEPSAKTIAGLIRQIRREGIKALFLENIGVPRLAEQLARETGTVLGPPLYSDALSRPNGPAPTYVRMIEHNTAALIEGMLKN